MPSRLEITLDRLAEFRRALINHDMTKRPSHVNLIFWEAERDGLVSIVEELTQQAKELRQCQT